MTRTIASAKAAGARFERQVADYLAAHVDDRIDRRVKTGAKDRGDIGGLRHQGHRIVVESKNTTRIALGPWTREAETERCNDNALIGVVAHKRHGTADPGAQFITMTLADFVALLTGKRPEETP